MTNPVTSPKPEPMRIGEPGDLIELIPFLLGFHPADSVVIVGLAGTRLGPVARVDLEVLGCLEVGQRVTPLQRSGCTTAVVVVYSTAPDGSGVLPGDAEVVALSRACEDSGITVSWAYLVHGNRFWSFTDLGGTASVLPGDTSPVAATAISQGLSVVPRRDDLLAVFAPRPVEAQVHADTMAQEAYSLREVPMGAEDVDEACKLILDTARTLIEARAVTDLPVERLAVLGALLDRIPVRDAVWLAVDAGEADGLALWQQLFTRLPAPWSAPALFLYGWEQFRSGNATMASEACDRARAAAPDYSAARLLSDAISVSVNPVGMPLLRELAAAE